MAARNYEDFLQVMYRYVMHSMFLTIAIQCAIPVFHGLLPEPHNTKIVRLLFTFSHWHGLAKLCMHTEMTLQILNVATTDLGAQLHAFQSDTCINFKTFELKHKAKSRQ